MFCDVQFSCLWNISLAFFKLLKAYVINGLVTCIVRKILHNIYKKIWIFIHITQPIPNKICSSTSNEQIKVYSTSTELTPVKLQSVNSKNMRLNNPATSSKQEEGERQTTRNYVQSCKMISLTWYVSTVVPNLVQTSSFGGNLRIAHSLALSRLVSLNCNFTFYVRVRHLKRKNLITN